MTGRCVITSLSDAKFCPKADELWLVATPADAQRHLSPDYHSEFTPVYGAVSDWMNAFASSGGKLVPGYLKLVQNYRDEVDPFMNRQNAVVQSLGGVGSAFVEFMGAALPGIHDLAMDTIHQSHKGVWVTMAYPVVETLRGVAGALEFLGSSARQVWDGQLFTQSAYGISKFLTTNVLVVAGLYFGAKGVATGGTGMWNAMQSLSAGGEAFATASGAMAMTGAVAEGVVASTAPDLFSGALMMEDTSAAHQQPGWHKEAQVRHFLESLPGLEDQDIPNAVQKFLKDAGLIKENHRRRKFIESVARLLRSPDVTTRQKTLIALDTIGYTAAKEFLIRGLDDPSPAVVATSLKMLVNKHSSFFRGLTVHTRLTRLLAIRELKLDVISLAGKLGTSGDAILGPLLTTSRDTDTLVTTLYALGDSPHPMLEKQVSAFLEHPDSSVVRSAIYALGGNTTLSDTTLQVLAMVVRYSPEESLRLSAIRALGSVYQSSRHPYILDTLDMALRDPSAECRGLVRAFFWRP